jgi:hypothetical protein
LGIELRVSNVDAFETIVISGNDSRDDWTFVSGMELLGGSVLLGRVVPRSIVALAPVFL